MPSPPLGARDNSPRFNAIRHAWSVAFLLLWGASTALMALYGSHVIPFAVIGFAATILLPPVAAKWTVRRLFERALARIQFLQPTGDLAALGAACEEIRSLLPARTVPQTASLVAYLFLVEERWEECLRTYDVVERGRLTPTELLAHDNLRAWAMVHAGRQEEALSIARAVVDEARRTAHPGLGDFVDTLGVAELRMGDPENALASLTEAMELTADARMRAGTAFYRGEALRALHRMEEARAEYQRAIDAKSSARWAERASERIATLPAAPYRQ